MCNFACGYHDESIGCRPGIPIPIFYRFVRKTCCGVAIYEGKFRVCRFAYFNLISAGVFGSLRAILFLSLFLEFRARMQSGEFKAVYIYWVLICERRLSFEKYIEIS